MNPNFVLEGILLISAIGLAAGFIPTAARLAAADLTLSNEGRSFTHGDMTRAAILRIAADVLIANPNPDNPDSASDIQQLQNQDSLSVSCLIDAYYGTSGDLGTVRARQKLQLERAIDDINDYQARTDTDEEDVAAAHFDSEQFADAQQRLVDFREIITMEISRGNYESARRFMGRLLHTLQDFYSHSNWIEIAVERGETNPSPNLDLGVRGKSVGNTAGPSTPTCRDCTKTGDVVLSLVIGVLPFIGSTSCYEDCESNIMLPDGVLTTGYADGGRDSQNRVIPKPSGKCSHGGLIDGTQDSPARGGINKDSTHEKLSPHFRLHALASTTAREHSYVMFSTIREDVNNDGQFSEFLGLEVEVNRVVSLAVAIDATITQATHQAVVALIPQIVTNISQYITAFENDLEVQYIVVPFDSSGVGNVYETTDSNQFKNIIAGLSLQNSSVSGTVPTVEAVLAAGRASEADSSIFVFTNSPPSDENLLGQAEAITAQRNLKVFFVDDAIPMNKRSIGDSLQLHHNIRHKRIIGISPVYSELEIFSGGGIVSVPTDEISDLATFISFSAIESDSVLFRREAPSGDMHYFIVDSYTFEVLIFINGRSFNLSAVTTPQGTDATLLMQYTEYAISDTLYIAGITIDNNSTLFGWWDIEVESQGPYHIQILGDGELTFSTDLITTHPNTTDDINDLKPLMGLNMSAELIIVGSAMPVDITTLNIINEQEVLQAISIVNSMSDSIVAMFMPPLGEFKLQAIGVDDRGYNFSYISDVSVEPTSISLAFGPIDNGYLTLRPGTEADVTIVLLNRGTSQQFRISVILDTSFDVDSTAVQYTINNNRPLVSQDSQTDITINVMLSSDAPVGLSVTFTVVAQSESDFDVNDFITFDAVTIRELSSSATGIVYKSRVKMNVLMTMLILLLLLRSSVWG